MMKLVHIFIDCVSSFLQVIISLIWISNLVLMMKYFFFFFFFAIDALIDNKLW